MFDSTSRYAKLPILTLERSGSDPVAYVARRFLPPAESLQTLAETEVQSHDRIDLVTSRTLGDPTQSWRVADANNAMDPGELLEPPGRVLRIPVPQP